MYSEVENDPLTWVQLGLVGCLLLGPSCLTWCCYTCLQCGWARWTTRGMIGRAPSCVSKSVQIRERVSHVAGGGSTPIGHRFDGAHAPRKRRGGVVHVEHAPREHTKSKCGMQSTDLNGSEEIGLGNSTRPEIEPTRTRMNCKARAEDKLRVQNSVTPFSTVTSNDEAGDTVHMCEWQNDGTYDQGVIGAKVMDRWLSDGMTSFMSCRQVLAGGKADPSRHIECTKNNRRA